MNVSRALLQMLTLVCFSFNVSEPTDHQPAGLHQEEDDPNLHPNLNPKCPSAKLCMPTTLRTQTSSASTLMTLLTSSKRVSAWRDIYRAFFILWNVTLIWSCLLVRCLRVVDRTTAWKAGTFPQQLRHQDLEAAGLQHEEESLPHPCWPSQRTGWSFQSEKETLWDFQRRETHTSSLLPS